MIVFLFQFDLIIDEGHNCQHRYLAPLFQCMVPTPVIVPNRHSPEKYSVISRKYFRFQTCVVGPSKLVVGHIDNRPVAMGLPIKHLTLIPETNHNPPSLMLAISQYPSTVLTCPCSVCPIEIHVEEVELSQSEQVVEVGQTPKSLQLPRQVAESRFPPFAQFDPSGRQGPKTIYCQEIQQQREVNSVVNYTNQKCQTS